SAARRVSRLAIASTVCHHARRFILVRSFELRDVFIAGVGQTPITKDPASRGRYLGAAALNAALADAGIERERIGALYVGNMLSGILARQQQLGGLIADYAGLTGIEAVTIEAACASGGAALRMAYQAVAGGLHDAVAVCGVER